MGGTIEITDRLIEALMESRNKDTESHQLRDGRELWICNGQIVQEVAARKKVKPITLHTLQGVVDYCKSKRIVDDAVVEYAINVQSREYVEVFELSAIDERHTHVQCEALPSEGSTLTSAFLPISEAVIALRLGFVQGPEVDALIKTLSSVKIENLTELRDGPLGSEVVITSNVGAGDAKESSTVSNLRLKPLRSFPEVEEIEVAYTMRWKKNGEKDVLIRLIEHTPELTRTVDVEAIREFLVEALPGMLVLA